MTDDHTPDTEQIREQYTRERPPIGWTVGERRVYFDRWLAADRAEVAEKARADERERIGLRIEAADVLASSWWADGRDNYVDRARAFRTDLARIARTPDPNGDTP